MLCLICLVASWSSNNQVTFVHFLPRQNQLVVALADVKEGGKSIGSLGVWDVTTGKCVRRIPGTAGDDLSQASLSKDGALIATGGRDREPVIVREVATGRVLRQFEPGLNAYPRCVFLSDGRTIALLASAQFTEYGHLEVETCALPDGELVKLISSDGASGLAVDPTGNAIAVETRRVAGSMNTLHQTITCGLYIYDGKGALIQSLPSRDRITNMGFSADGKLFGVRKSNGRLELIDTATWHVKRTLISQSSPNSIGFDEGTLLFTAKGETLVVSLEGLGVTTYDLGHGTQRTTPARPRTLWKSIDVSADGKTLATGTTDGKVEIRSIKDGKILKLIPITQPTEKS